MDVRCERCKTEYELDDARVTEAGVPVKCATCGYVFRVKKKALVVTVPMRPGETMEGAATLSPAGSTPVPEKPGEKAREWRIRIAKGNVATLRELTTLQRWIVERKVSRTDEISLTGESWKTLGDIPELLPFFEIVDEAQKAHAMLHAQSEANANANLSSSLAPPSVAPIAPAPVHVPLPREPVTEIPLPPKPAPWSQLPESTIIDDVPIQARTTSSEKWTAIGAPPEPPPRAPTPIATRSVRTAARRTVSEDELPIANFKRSSGGSKWAILVLVLFAGAGAAYYFWMREGFAESPAPTVGVDAGQKETGQLPEPIVDASPSPSGLTPALPLDASAIANITISDPGETNLPPVAMDAGPSVVAVTPPAVGDAGSAVPIKREVVRDFDFYIAQGDRLRERDRPEAAMGAYGKAIDLAPDRAEAHAGRGLALLDLGRKPPAEAAFQQALKLNARYGVALMGLAETYRSMGKKEEAIRYYEKYLDVAPSGTESSAARAAIQKLQE